MAPLSLLSLPREIRDLIIELAISHVCPAPTSPQTAHRSGHYARRHDMNGWLSDKCLETYDTADPALYPVLGSPITPVVSPWALRATSHQLRAETGSAMRRIPRIFEVDVMLVDEEYLIVTWTRVPPLMLWPTSESLRLTIRPFGIWNSGPQTGPGDRGENSEAIFGGPVDVHDQDRVDEVLRRLNGFTLTRTVARGTIPGKALCAFSLLFERFFRGGAYGEKFPHMAFDGEVSIRELSIMIKKPTDVSADMILAETVAPSQGPEERHINSNQRDWRMSPIALELMMVEWFKALPGIDQMPNQPKNLGMMMDRVDNMIFASEDGPRIQFKRGISPYMARWEPVLDADLEVEDEAA
jgi:hypothetical protein